jgi:quinolinate synthase
MAMNALDNLAQTLESGANEVHVEEGVRVKALRATQRMLDFAASIRQKNHGD